MFGLEGVIFEPMNFVENLQYMGIGMLGVFLIVGIIMTAVYVIGSLKNSKTED